MAFRRAGCVGDGHWRLVGQQAGRGKVGGSGGECSERVQGRTCEI